ncbi:MAG: NADH-quinone oxidoreductase subunit NuoE [Armatimonadota bacterium]
MDTAVLDKIIEKRGKTRSATIPILQDIQEHFRYLPEEALEYVTKNTDIKETQIYGVATFYSQFKLNPAGENIIKVCHGTACHVVGAEKITEGLKEYLKINLGQTTLDRLFTLEAVACLGCCSLAPVMMINDKIYGHLTPKKAIEIIKKYEKNRDN